MKWIFLLSLFLISNASLAIVDIRSAGYSKTFVDFKTKDSGLSMKVERTYNSRSLFNGLFGFGWCSNFETQLEVLPDDSLKVTECGGGTEIFYYPKNKQGNTNLQVNLILKEIQAKKVKMSKKSLTQLKKDLFQSQTLRADFLKSLGIKGKVRTGISYYASGKFNEFITFKGKSYTRSLPNDLTEIFNNKGQIVKMYDKFGNSMKISWQKESIRIVDNRGRLMELFVNSKNKKIQKVKFNNKVVAKYIHKGEDLASIINSYKEKFSHSYDKVHNLKETIYPDKTKESISYNVNKDWVTGFNDRNSCEEKYTYGKNPKNKDHYFSIVKKTCGRKIVNKSKYEFWNKTLADGSKYLHRARARVNGRLKTDVIYHAKFGLPISFLKNGVRTKRSYYANGFLKLKEDPHRSIQYAKYSKQCGKPEIVKILYKDKKASNKVIKRDNLQFKFAKNCQLLQAFRSKDEWIKVKYDSRGRLSYMEDQSRKVIELVWHKTFNKPHIISRKGIGSIQLVYNASGDIVDLKSGKNGGPTIITQVSSVFNSFLQTLSPVAEEMVVL